jgi:hypothetical protein
MARKRYTRSKGSTLRSLLTTQTGTSRYGSQGGPTPAPPKGTIPPASLRNSNPPSARQSTASTHATQRGPKGYSSNTFVPTKVADTERQAHVAHLKRKYGSGWYAADQRQKARLRHHITLGPHRTAEDLAKARRLKLLAGIYEGPDTPFTAKFQRANRNNPALRRRRRNKGIRYA